MNWRLSPFWRSPIAFWQKTAGKLAARKSPSPTLRSNEHTTSKPSASHQLGNRLPLPQPRTNRIATVSTESILMLMEALC